jgi:nucleoside-diphosphate-sugar epimerase
MNGISPLENTTAVVTGATGFIGSHLVDYLVEYGCTVHALVRETSDRKWLNKSAQVKVHIVDLLQISPIDCLQEADYLFNCAGLTKAKTRDDYFCGNVYPCETLYERCVAIGTNLKAIIHLSSLAAAGPSVQGEPAQEKNSCKPVTYYGESKLAGEKIALKFASQLPIVVIRPPVVYGPREENFFVYLKTLSLGWNIKIGATRRELSLVYITDIVRAMVQAAVCYPKNEKIYYVTDGVSYIWNDISDTAMSIFDIPAKTIVIPELLLIFLSRVSETLAWFSLKPALFDRQRVIDICQTSWVASPIAFFESHKFQPEYNLAKGLQETIDWGKKNNWF